MNITLGSIAPDFTAESSAGTLNLHDYIGEHWCVFFSHPRDFSAVCMTELGLVSRLKPELDRRNARALGLSIATVEDHIAWSRDFAQAQGCALNFPLVADPGGEIAGRYGMLHPQHAAGVTSRCLFIIDPAKKVRMFAVYPTSVGRNFDEVLRVLDSLQLTVKHALVTPANWRPGERAVIPPSISDDVARERFPAGFESVTPYLRLVDLPGG
jgi:alkyl hydroperoxide reductase subunit AhpC